jgi:ankyrin repeat protein
MALNEDLYYKILVAVSHTAPETLIILYRTGATFKRLLDKYPSLWIKSGVYLMFGPVHSIKAYDAPSIYQSKAVPFLYMSCSLGLVNAAYCFIKGGYPVNYRHIITQTTPLISAALNKNIQLCRLLISFNADVGMADDHVQTALSKAASAGSYHICKLLIDNKSPLDTQCILGMTALHYACQNNHMGVAKLLVDNGADISLCNARIETCLHVSAACASDASIASAIVHRNKSILEAKEQNGRTALHIAVINENERMCLGLLRECANVNAMDASGCSPLHYAVYGGHSSICKLLVEFGGNPKQTNNSGFSAFDEAVSDSVPVDDLKGILRSRFASRVYYTVPVAILVASAMLMQSYFSAASPGVSSS